MTSLPILEEVRSEAGRCARPGHYESSLPTDAWETNPVALRNDTDWRPGSREPLGDRISGTPSG
jgi:hypothetical protein